MNNQAAIMLVNKDVRPVRVTYDPDSAHKNNPNRLFKTFLADLKKDDYVVVPTSTRHGYTVCQVVEVDFAVNFDGADAWDWIVGRVDNDSYKSVVEQEKVVISKIAKAQENRRRLELAKDMQLGEVDFSDLDVVKENSVLLTSTASPRGDATLEAPLEVPPETPPQA